MPKSNIPPEERFWLKVDRANDGCWLWTARIGTTGYGQFSNFLGRTWGSHRLAYYLTYGEIPKGMYVCHKCDNRPCCRPDHLFLGTAKDNMQDKMEKGRHLSAAKAIPSGEAHWRTELTENDVRRIRFLHAEQKLSFRAIATMFPVTEGAIARIAQRKRWANVS